MSDGIRQPVPGRWILTKNYDQKKKKSDLGVKRYIYICLDAVIVNSAYNDKPMHKSTPFLSFFRLFYCLATPPPPHPHPFVHSQRTHHVTQIEDNSTTADHSGIFGQLVSHLCSIHIRPRLSGAGRPIEQSHFLSRIKHAQTRRKGRETRKGWNNGLYSI